MYLFPLYSGGRCPVKAGASVPWYHAVVCTCSGLSDRYILSEAPHSCARSRGAFRSDNLRTASLPYRSSIANSTRVLFT
jgi:hypothetical protein